MTLSTPDAKPAYAPLSSRSTTLLRHASERGRLLLCLDLERKTRYELQPRFLKSRAMLTSMVVVGASNSA